MLGLVMLSGCGTIGRVGELFVSGGETVLRDPLRPVRGGPRVLVVALDGVGEARLREALAAGDMPRLAALLGPPAGDNLWTHAVEAPGVLSVLPAETSAGWAAVFTGATPARSGIPGNEWFDRNTLRSSAPVPLSVKNAYQTVGIYTDDFFGEAVRTATLFEQADVRAHVALGFVHRGADVLSVPDPGDLADVVRGIGHFVAGSTAAVYSLLDDDTRAGVRRAMRRHGVPDLQVAYLPGVDLVAHDAGADAQRAYLRDRVDNYIGDILDLYRDRGALDSLFVVVVSDHGHTETLADDRHSLGGDGDADEPVAILDSLGYRVRPFATGRDTSAYDAALAYNEAFASVFLADRSTCLPPDGVCDWTRPPRLEADVLPVARAFAAADRDAASALFGAVDLVFARVSDPSGQTSPRFQIYDAGRLVPIPDYLEATRRPDLLALDRRLGWLTDGPYGHLAGDVMLLARGGPDQPIDSRFYFGSPRRSGHGRPSTQDSTIPLVLAHPVRSGESLRASMTAAVGETPTQLDVTPLILALLRAAPSE